MRGTRLASHTPRYWDGVARDWEGARVHRLWRDHCDLLNARYLRPWLPDGGTERALKTDLFDEATGTTGLVPLLAGAARQVFGIDVSLVTLRRASHRQPLLRAVGADVRSLPFPDGSFDIVLSNSTLDHFDSLDDVDRALRELYRVLAPGGRLLLTMDNLANPIVALRSVLPKRLLQRLHLVPYHVGATCGPRRLRRMVEQAGFQARVVGAMMHCPRAPAVFGAHLLDRFAAAWMKQGYLRFLRAWEGLGRWPTRYLSGYFVAVCAVRE